MVELKYPRGWSFAETDGYFSKKNPAKFRLDRDIYILAGSYGEAGVHGGINRFIEGMRKGFSVQDIVEGKYDGIIDENPKNHIVPDTPMPDIEVTNKDIESEMNPGYPDLDTMARELKKSPATINRWRKANLIAKIGERYYLNEPDSPEDSIS